MFVTRCSPSILFLVILKFQPNSTLSIKHFPIQLEKFLYLVIPANFEIFSKLESFEFPKRIDWVPLILYITLYPSIKSLIERGSDESEWNSLWNGYRSMSKKGQNFFCWKNRNRRETKERMGWIQFAVRWDKKLGKKWIFTVSTGNCIVNG